MAFCVSGKHYRIEHHEIERHLVCLSGGSSEASSTTVATASAKAVATALAKALATVGGTASSG